MDMDDTSMFGAITWWHIHTKSCWKLHSSKDVQKFYATMNYPSILDTDQQWACDVSRHRYFSAAPFISGVINGSSRVPHASPLKSVARLQYNPVDTSPLPGLCDCW